MHPIIAICLALLVLAFAYFIKHFASEIFEEEHDFLMVLAGFFGVYILAAIVIGYFSIDLPKLTIQTESATAAQSEPVHAVRLDEI